MALLETMKTMADATKWIEGDTAFTPAFRKKVLGSMRRMKRMVQYGGALDQIPADLKAFDAMWSRGSVHKLPTGFSSKTSFSTWRSQVRSGLVAYNGVGEPPKPIKLQDAWTELEAELAASGVEKKKLISFWVLAKCARADRLAPSAVTQTWLQQQIDDADTAGRYRALQAAYRLLNHHVAATPSSVAAAGCYGGPALQKSRKSCIRIPFAEPLKSEIDRWVISRTEGVKKGHLKKRKSSCTPQRAKASVLGISYVYTALITAGLIEANTPYSISDLSSPEFLEEVIALELGQEFPWQPLKPTTLFEYFSHWKLFIRNSGGNIEVLTEVIRDFTAFENVSTMSPRRLEWCESFLHDYHQKTAFFSLPITLHKKARAAMASYAVSSRYEQKVAIGLAIAACAAAIWTSLPLRISTLLQLTVGHEHADVQIHRSKHSLILKTPPDIVKNGYSHRYIELTPKPGGSPCDIVRWFVEEVRPHLMKHHLAAHLVRPDCLFGGLSDTRLRQIWYKVTLEAGVPMTPHQVRHALATVMANEPGADFSIIAALLGDTEGTVRKNYVFIDRIRKHVEGQKVIAGLQKNMLMQGIR